MSSIIKMAATLLAATVIWVTPAFAADTISEVRERVESFSARKNTWGGPIDGPKAINDKTIAVLFANSAEASKVITGIKEAAAIIGWDIREFASTGSAATRESALSQVLELKPDGIIIGGFDDVLASEGLAKAVETGIPIVAWHSALLAEPDDNSGIFAHVATDASIMASAAAQWAFVHGRGKPGVIIFTDSTNPIASAKADLIQAQIENLGATVLETVDIPLDDAPTQVRAQTPLLLDKYAKQWTYSIAVNDRYFDTIGYALAAAGIKGSGFPQSVGAGGGVPSAYQRIRAGLYQAATVAKPLNLQGWQLVDELNRALNGEAPSGYQTTVHLATTDNIGSDGGDLDQFDPQNGYREQYRKIWQ